MMTLFDTSVDSKPLLNAICTFHASKRRVVGRYHERYINTNSEQTKARKTSAKKNYDVLCESICLL